MRLHDSALRETLIAQIRGGIARQACSVNLILPKIGCGTEVFKVKKKSIKAKTGLENQLDSMALRNVIKL
jgi:hypothetical protein